MSNENLNLKTDISNREPTKMVSLEEIGNTPDLEGLMVHSRYLGNRMLEVEMTSHPSLSCSRHYELVTEGNEVPLNRSSEFRMTYPIGISKFPTSKMNWNAP